MKQDLPFYCHCFEVVSKSPLFINHDKKMIQDALLPFYRETLMKNSSEINSEKALHRFYIIVTGRLKVFQVNPITGREQTLFILGPGDAFDIICLLDGKEHVVNTMAMDDLEVLFAPVDKVRGWIVRHPEFNMTFLPYLGKQIREIEELASDLSLYDTGTRLSKLILSHVHSYHSRGRLKLIDNLSHEEIANMIGSVRVIVNRHIQNLKKEGIIKTSRKHMEISNLHSLVNKVEKHIGLQ
jgi:CRP/FNR family transcriptional regulator, cyclic AMP receptor protein